MIKILIVDDSPLFLEYLRDFMNWHEYGFEICGHALNGKEALGKIEECYPDIILSDIAMPYMDGLELAEKVMAEYPDIAIILITGKSEFEYAGRALRIGVCDYIVKPFDKEELILSLLKLKDNINKALENSYEFREQNKRNALRNVVLGDGTDLQEIGISFSTDYFLVGYVRLEAEEANIEAILNWEDILTSILKYIIRVNGTCEVFRGFQNDIVFVLNFENESEYKKYKAYELVDFPKIVARHTGMKCTVCIGDYCRSLQEVKKEYYRIQSLVKETDYNTLVKFFEKTESKVKEKNIYIPRFLIELNDSLMNRDLEQFSKLWEKEWKYAYAFGNINSQTQLISTLLGMLFSDIVNSGNCIESVFGEGFRPHVELYSIREIEKRVYDLRMYFGKWFDWVTKRKETTSEIVAARTKQYIQEHYMENDLNISTMSKELFINQTYLRKMFKSEVGKTIWEYLTEYRMEIAGQLLLSTDYNSNKIAEMTGYSDVGYFGKCFKKYYHMSPKEMRKAKGSTKL